MITLKKKEFYSASLPRCPITPTMEKRVLDFMSGSEMGKAETQRRAMDLFLSVVCQDWQSEYPETQALIKHYVSTEYPPIG